MKTNRIKTNRIKALCAALGLLAVVATSPAVLAADGPPRVRLTTSAGVIELELDPARAPQSVANFLDLVDSGFYEGLIFHRVVANFVIQTGGYDSALAYREPPRKVPNEAENGLRNVKGSIAMARLDDPDSADAQFFINVKDNPHLDRAPGKPGYTVFGRVIEGMDLVTGIELLETHIAGGMAGVPVQPVVIQKAERVGQTP
jgi:cyclophilin family peptidyl-prolyl cis-trans isomerase